VITARYTACWAIVSQESMRPVVRMSKTKPAAKNAAATLPSLRE
jgi:hypothetical protein